MLKIILAIVRARDTWLDVWRLFLFASAWFPQVITLRMIYKSLKVPYDSGHRAEWPHGARSSFLGGKMEFTMTLPTITGLLDAMTADGMPFDPTTMFMGLFTAGPEAMPPYTDVAFEFPALADFPRKSVTTWTVVDVQPDGSVQMTSPVLDFVFATWTDPTNFMGAYVAYAATAGADVIAFQVFDEMIQFLLSNSHAKFVMRLTTKPDSSYSLDIVRVDGE